jgi:hypothetical protein
MGKLCCGTKDMKVTLFGLLRRFLAAFHIDGTRCFHAIEHGVIRKHAFWNND